MHAHTDPTNTDSTHVSSLTDQDDFYASTKDAGAETDVETEMKSADTDTDAELEIKPSETMQAYLEDFSAMLMKSKFLRSALASIMYAQFSEKDKKTWYRNFLERFEFEKEFVTEMGLFTIQHPWAKNLVSPDFLRDVRNIISDSMLEAGIPDLCASIVKLDCDKTLTDKARSMTFGFKALLALKKSERPRFNYFVRNIGYTIDDTHNSGDEFMTDLCDTLAQRAKVKKLIRVAPVLKYETQDQHQKIKAIQKEIETIVANAVLGEFLCVFLPLADCQPEERSTLFHAMKKVEFLKKVIQEQLEPLCKKNNLSPENLYDLCEIIFEAIKHCMLFLSKEDLIKTYIGRFKKSDLEKLIPKIKIVNDPKLDKSLREKRSAIINEIQNLNRNKNAFILFCLTAFVAFQIYLFQKSERLQPVFAFVILSEIAMLATIFKFDTVKDNLSIPGKNIESRCLDFLRPSLDYPVLEMVQQCEKVFRRKIEEEEREARFAIALAKAERFFESALERALRLRVGAAAGVAGALGKDNDKNNSAGDAKSTAVAKTTSVKRKHQPSAEVKTETKQSETPSVSSPIDKDKRDDKGNIYYCLDHRLFVRVNREQLEEKFAKGGDNFIDQSEAAISNHRQTLSSKSRNQKGVKKVAETEAASKQFDYKVKIFGNHSLGLKLRPINTHEQHLGIEGEILSPRGLVKHTG